MHPSAGTTTLRYDEQGNLKFDGSFEYAYDSAGRMVMATPVNRTTHPNRFEAGYDDQGRRIWKKSYAWTPSTTTGGHVWTLVESRKFVYDGWNLVAEFVADAQGVDRLARAYAWGQETVGGGIGALLSITAFAADGTVATYLPLMDGSGNVTGLVDASTGNVVATYRYDPFGNLIEKTGTTDALAANPFGFSTKYFDAETGLYYYGYRYYSPELGKWMTRDPLQEAK